MVSCFHYLLLLQLFGVLYIMPVAQYDDGNCFMCSIDATADSAEASKEGRRLGRLVNHSKMPHATAYPKLIIVGSTPHLCLFAARALEAGEQVLYDYGVKLPFCDLVCDYCAYMYVTVAF